MPLLGVNIDHVATIRQARRGDFPDPVRAALICQDAGADSIVAHLREDRRHINDRDVDMLKRSLSIRFNLEMSIQEEIVDVACNIKPDQVTLVPERRQELTTEGGLDVLKKFKRLLKVIPRLAGCGIDVSLFIDPVFEQIAASRDLGIDIIELHTGRYAEARNNISRRRELKILKEAAAYGLKLGLTVNAGHGLKYDNAREVAAIRGMHELNIGHSIISQAVLVGLSRAVSEMKAIARLEKQ